MTQPKTVDEIPRCPHIRCGMVLTACPSGGCGEPDFQCPVDTEWPHGVDQSKLPPQHRWIPIL